MEELECDSVLYQQSSFVFDPEDVRENGGIFHLISILPSLQITNADNVTVLVTSASLATLLVRASYTPKLLVLGHGVYQYSRPVPEFKSKSIQIRPV